MRIGILGGGQLAKMTAVAAAQLGIESLVWSTTEGQPALQACTRSVIGSLDNPSVQDRIIDGSDVITLENEFIPATILHQLQARGGTVLPSPESVAVVQDKWTQKSALAAQGLPVAEGRALTDISDIAAVERDLGFTLAVKTRRLGYDGHGTFRTESAAELAALFQTLNPSPDLLMAERSVSFSREISVLVTRAGNDALVTYPVVETRQPQLVCEEVLAPAPLPNAGSVRAKEIAERAVRALNLVGTAAVEMFMLADGLVLINEIAPRPHNSGHFSIEACQTSQFENHVRAITDLPLGSAAMQSPAAVMVNILGRLEGPITPTDLAPALAVEGAHVHLYGKSVSRPMRKLGHITVMAPTLEQARERALAARDALRF